MVEHAHTESQQAPEGHYNVHATPVGHGNSPAAWAMFLIMIVGAFISCVAFGAASSLWFWIGIAIIVVGLIVGFIMSKAGYGVDGSKLQGSGH